MSDSPAHIFEEFGGFLINQLSIDRLEDFLPISRFIGELKNLSFGSRGPAGPRGETGPVGQAGPAGPRGETGPAGQAGATGLRGETGPAGETGPPGQAAKPVVPDGSGDNGGDNGGANGSSDRRPRSGNGSRSLKDLPPAAEVDWAAWWHDLARDVDIYANERMGGRPGQTISNRAAEDRIRGGLGGRLLCAGLDWVDPGHCDQSLFSNSGLNLFQAFGNVHLPPNCYPKPDLKKISC